MLLSGLWERIKGLYTGLHDDIQVGVERIGNVEQTLTQVVEDVKKIQAALEGINAALKVLQSIKK